MRRRFAFAAGVTTALAAACAPEGGRSETRLTGTIVEYGRVAGAPLRGVLYLPRGKPPHPVLVYAHGSARGFLNNEAFEAIAPAFTARGWAVFAPYRRGQGLSHDAGPFIRDQIASARSDGGADRAQEELARLLATDHLSDHAQALAWVSKQPFADARRVATMGNSFGGIIALLSAGKPGLCAAVDAAGAADSWKEAPAVRTMMISAASRARAPVLFIQARNDFDLAPSHVLAGVMRRAGKSAAVRIYPPSGSTAQDGHAFTYKAVGTWASDVHAFLSRACP